MPSCLNLLVCRSGRVVGRTAHSSFVLREQILFIDFRHSQCMSKRQIFSSFNQDHSPTAFKRQKSRHELRRLMNTNTSDVAMNFRDKPIQLTEVEATLKRLLVDAASYIDENPSTEFETSLSLPDGLSKAKLELRFTGGWVRDKLLGIGSHDIDVAINKMTGYQFGLRLKEYLELPNVASKYGLEGVAQNDHQSEKAGKPDKSKIVSGLHKIEANPEKSKHLETVTTRIFGLDIDLVNLRKETYTEDSRNPQIEFGTPEEDALRRDATVNAMFYNLSTSAVEDLTGEGFNDMEKKVIRTPLEPYQTFKDDPLRVLRLIRFASRLGYNIDRTAQESMKNDEIKEALKIKISRERIGVELEKMLKGPDPRNALCLIDDLGLYQTIFTDPTVSNSFEPELQNWHVAYDMLEAVLRGQDGEIVSFALRNPDEKFLSWTLCTLVPLADAPKRHTSRFPFATDVAREGFKAPNKVCDVVTAAIRNQQEIIDIVQRCSGSERRSEVDRIGRDTLGMAIRRWGASWRSQILFTLMHEAVSNPEHKEDTLQRYARFLQEVSSLDLLEVHTFKPIIDGRALAKALGTAPGPWMKDALEVVMAWQLRNPNHGDPSAAIEEVKSQRQANDGGELTASLIDCFLRLTIRPLFARSHPIVTAAGRRKLQPEERPYESVDEEQQKPWKYREKSCLDLLRWVLKKINTDMVENSWPLLTPPILTILDDPDPPTKALGCDFVSLLLSNTPPALLARTGLGEVIEEALMPCLTYLPTLTPESDSIILLDAAFPALITLSNVRFPISPSSRSGSASAMRQKRAKFLDQVLRRGVLSGFLYAGEYVKIAIVLLTHLAALTKELGIEFVKHLKDVLPLITRVLSDPFGPASPELLLAATKAEQIAILNAWPRIGFHRGEVLKGVSVCWINLTDSENEVDEVVEELQETVEMLMVAVREEVDWKSEFEELSNADERLQPLFARLF